MRALVLFFSLLFSLNLSAQDVGLVDSVLVWSNHFMDLDDSIAALRTDINAGGGGGSSPSFFQVEDDGTTTQLTTGSFADVTTIWGTPSITDADFSFTSGVLTVNAAGTLVLDILVHSWNNANNRHELHVRVMRDTGGGFAEEVEASSYTSRNNTQDEGKVAIPGFKLAVSSGDEIKIQILDVGVAASVGGSTIPGQTYISATLWP